MNDWQMQSLDVRPGIIFAVSLLLLGFAGYVGAFLRKRRQQLGEDERDFGTLLAATLTLLGLIIGFTFSMATGRYDQRKNYEESEANAIGTEYVRATLLPAADAAKVRGLLKKYLDQRIAFYEERDEEAVAGINATTAQLQDELWSAVAAPAGKESNAISSLVASGMNDVLNSQGYTQAAWWNRIPVEAWALMVIIGICGNFLFGFSSRADRRPVLLLVLPVLLAVSFFLIADIESPRRGLIRVRPQNLISLSRNLPQ